MLATMSKCLSDARVMVTVTPEFVSERLVKTPVRGSAVAVSASKSKVTGAASAVTGPSPRITAATATIERVMGSSWSRVDGGWETDGASSLCTTPAKAAMVRGSAYFGGVDFRDVEEMSTSPTL